MEYVQSVQLQRDKELVGEIKMRIENINQHFEIYSTIYDNFRQKMYKSNFRTLRKYLEDANRDLKDAEFMLNFIPKKSF
jgi:hypothetical protein